MKGKYQMSDKNYVSKEELYNEIVHYFDTGLVSDHLHLMIFDMAKRIVTKGRFHGYTWKEDMVTDGYLRCIKYLKSYDLTKKNPFAYFTTIIYHTYWAYRTKEMDYQNKKWIALSNLVTKMEHEFNITLAMPDNIKEKVYSSCSTFDDTLEEQND